MKHIPLLTVTPVTVEVVRRDDSHFVDILAITCGENNIFLKVGDIRRAQRYWNPESRVSTWILTDALCRDYSPFPAAMISEETISEVGEVEQGPAALDHVREIWADCPAVRPMLNKILRFFR